MYRNGECALKNLSVSIRSGQTFKGPLEKYNRGEVAVVLPKNIVGDRIADAVCIDGGEIGWLDKHRLQPGEILIVNKGAKFNPFVYRGEPRLAVATTAFYVITPGESLLPEYLLWYLNQPEAKSYLTTNARGSTVPLITLAVLGDLPVPLIPLADQQWVCDFIREMKTEQAFLKELLKKREEFAESFIWERIQQNYGA